MNIRDALEQGGLVLSDYRERQILLLHVLKISREFAIAHSEYEVSRTDLKKFLKLCLMRTGGMPIAYLISKQEFYGLDFFVDKNVLIPRPETETLVEKTIQLAGKRHISILDVGTGSGCIAITLAKNLPNAKIFASDISGDALKIARKNAKKHGVSSHIKFIKGDILKPFVGRKLDIIVANLPYIATREKGLVDLSVKKFEPRTAIWAGRDGMKYLNKLFIQLRKLKPLPAYLLAEFGYLMKTKLQARINKLFPSSSIKFYKDLAGHSRMFILELNNHV